MNLNCFKNKQSVEEVLNRRAVKTITRVFYDKGFYDIYENAYQVLKNFLVVE